MIKIGITGGIGSGKSTVSNIFKLLDIPVYIADTESKRLTESSPDIRSKLIEAFGNDLYDGTRLNKKLFASIIFSDKEKLALANSIIHPEVYKDFEKWIESHNSKSIVALETAILYESGMNRYVDKALMIYTPIEERIKYIMKRDSISREEVSKRIGNQLPDEDKAKRADHIIHNNEAQSLIRQSIDIISKYERRRTI